MRNTILLAALLAVFGCESADDGAVDAAAMDGSTPSDAAVDSVLEHDAAVDSGIDAGADAGGDASAPDFCALPAVAGNCDAYFERWYHDPELGSCERFIYGGCGGNDNNFETLAACEAACDVTPRSEPCSTEATDPSLPGVTLRIEGERCTARSNQPLRFALTVTLDDAIAYTAPDEGAGCGSCTTYDDDPRSLFDFSVGGGAVNYCVCDVGCCAPGTSHAVTLAAGTAARTIDWPGREWNGPSDTDEPYGPAFPAGSYAVRASFEVPGVGTVAVELPIEVTTAAP